jgi:16S rRNA (uracil1498-N3)-methyltransferase
MNLLLVEAAELSPRGEVTLVGDRARHLREVLKVGVGSEVRVGCVDGPIGAARVEALEGGSVRLACRLEGAPPPRPAVDLLLALPRPKVLKRLWAQLAALGVGTVVLTNASRVERYYFDSHAVREEEIRPRLLEGLAQARDTRLPAVHVRRAFKPLVEDELDALFGESRRLLADPVYERSVIDAVRQRRARVLLALGPEGGWSPFERDLLERSGFVGVGLGSRTLRSDTATLALLALTHEALRT